MLDIQVKGADELRAMARALRRADRVDLAPGLARAIKRAADPTLEDLRSAARKIRTRGVGTPKGRRQVYAVKGMRQKIADAVVADVKINEDSPRVSFAVRNSRLPTELRGMPRVLDASADFRHPTFGHRDRWVAQTSDPWFFHPIKQRLDSFREEIGKELDLVRDKLERGPLA